MRSFWLFISVLGCAAPRPAPAPSSAPRASASVIAPPPPSSAATTACCVAPPIAFKSREAPASPSALPKLAFVEPAFGDTLEPRFALRHEVEVRVEGSELGEQGQGAGVVISLDGRHPRRLSSVRGLTLADLLADQDDLALGAHALLAVAVDAQGEALQGSTPEPRFGVAVSGFYVGPRSSDALNPALPSLFCLNPAGTVYVRRGESIPFQVLALNTPSEHLVARVRGPSREFQTEIDAGRPYDVSGLELGDTRISVGREPGPRAECVVTLNPLREVPKP
jgi:hypothetical protein